MPGTCVTAPPAALPSKDAFGRFGIPAPLSKTGVVSGFLSLSATRVALREPFLTAARVRRSYGRGRDHRGTTAPPEAEHGAYVPVHDVLPHPLRGAGPWPSGWVRPCRRRRVLADDRVRGRVSRPDDPPRGLLDDEDRKSVV